jgi:DNA (cytosine-5)-methyltransferase 1
MKHLDLFSGIGGFALACSWVWGDQYENVGHSEIEPFPCKVYHKHFPESECLGDITKIKWTEGQADLITGGFPCQPHSMAGKRRASGDERDLWGECVRALCGVRPSYALFENVPGLLTSERGRFFNRVLSDLAQSGYDAEWQTISAASVGAPHKRDRIWIVAYPRCEHGAGPKKRRELARSVSGAEDAPLSQRSDCYGEQRHDANAPHNPTNDELSLANTGCVRSDECKVETAGNKQHNRIPPNPDLPRSQGRGQYGERTGERLVGPGTWEEPWLEVATRLCRVDDGVRNRVDRLKGLGNGIVPQVARVVLEKIKEHDRLNHRKGE